MKNTQKVQTLSNEPVPGMKSVGPCRNFIRYPDDKPAWLSIRDQNATMNDRICDFVLYDADEPCKLPCFDIHVEVMIPKKNLVRNHNGTWSCTYDKTLKELRNIYLSTHDPKTGIRTYWMYDTGKADMTIAELNHSIQEAFRRKNYPKYLYLMSVTNDLTGRKISDFTLYTRHRIPNLDLNVIKLIQERIPEVYKQPDGTYRCIDEKLRFGDTALDEAIIKIKDNSPQRMPCAYPTLWHQPSRFPEPWHQPRDFPDRKLCEMYKNRFVAWDGENTYIVTFDEYDKIFRKPVNIGGIIKNNPDTDIKLWACLPAPPAKDQK